MSARSHKAVFLDRDGTIIEDRNYLGDPAEINLLTGAVEALKSLQERDYLLAVITNQSGIARGFFDEAAYRAVDRRLREILAAEGVRIAATYHCPHLPGAPVLEYDRLCDCRKPGKGLFERAAEELAIDFSHSWSVGDSLRDLQPAKELGARTALVLTGKGREQAARPEAKDVSDIIAADILEASRMIIGTMPA